MLFRSNNMEAFFRATFDTWRDYKRTDRQVAYVGYSPIIGVDGEKIIQDLPHGHVLHVVRNPWSAYADTKKRPVPMSLESYMLCWNVNQYYALLGRKKYPGRYHVVRTEDVMADSTKALTPVLEAMGLEGAESLATPTFNGEPLTQVYPWGTIRTPTPEANKATAEELSGEEIDSIRTLTWQYQEVLGYTNFI